MKYTPVVAIKHWKIVSIIPPEAGAVGFVQGNMTAESLKKVPAIIRVSALASLLSLQFILSEENPAECLTKAGWPEESIKEEDIFKNKDEMLAEISESLTHLRSLWITEFSIAQSAVFDLDTALYCIARPIENQVPEAFCPKGSKGFVRIVAIAGINNPAAEKRQSKTIETEIPKTFDEFLSIMAKKAGLIKSDKTSMLDCDEVEFLNE